METGYKLYDIMKKPVHAVDVSQTIEQAAKLMKENAVGCLIVTDSQKPVGILTEKDIIRKSLAFGHPSNETAVQSIMTSPILSMDSGADVYDAFLFLNNKSIRHLPISNGKNIDGIVTMSDLLRLQPAIIEASHFKALNEAAGLQ